MMHLASDSTVLVIILLFERNDDEMEDELVLCLH